MPDQTTSNSPIDVLYVDIRADTEGLKRQIKEALRETRLELASGLSPVVRDLEKDLQQVADKIKDIGANSKNLANQTSSLRSSSSSGSYYNTTGTSTSTGPTYAASPLGGSGNQDIVKKLDELKTHLSSAFAGQSSQSFGRDDVTVSVTRLTEELGRITRQFEEATRSIVTLASNSKSATTPGTDTGLSNKLERIASSLEKSITSANGQAGNAAGQASQTLQVTKMDVEIVECPYCSNKVNVNALAQKNELAWHCPNCGGSLKGGQKSKMKLDMAPSSSGSSSPSGLGGGVGSQDLSALVTALREIQQKSAVNVAGDSKAGGADLNNAALELTKTITSLSATLDKLGVAVTSMQTANTALQSTVQQSSTSTLQAMSSIGANLAEMARLIPASLIPYKTAADAGTTTNPTVGAADKQTEVAVDQSKAAQSARLAAALKSDIPAWAKETSTEFETSAEFAKQKASSARAADESRIRAALPWRKGSAGASQETADEAGSGLLASLKRFGDKLAQGGEDVVVKLALFGEKAAVKAKEVGAGAVEWGKNFYKESGGNPIGLVENIQKYIDVIQKVVTATKGSGSTDENVAADEQVGVSEDLTKAVEKQTVVAETQTRTVEQQKEAVKQNTEAVKTDNESGGTAPGGSKRAGMRSWGEVGAEQQAGGGVLQSIARLLGGGRGGGIGNVGGLGSTLANTATVAARTFQASGGDVMQTAAAGAGVLTQGLQGVASAGGALAAALGPVLAVVGALGAAFAGWQAVLAPTIRFFQDLGKEGMDLASRVDTLKASLEVTAKNSGIAIDTMRDKLQGLQATGIKTKDAMQTMSQFMSSNLPIDSIEKLARSGQNLAVAYGKDSSETFNRFTWAIMSGSTEMLRTIGIQKTAASMMEAYAKSLNKSVESLTMVERRQAMVNGIMKETAQYTGLYDKAMDSLDKKMQSMGRYKEEATLAFGQALLPLKESEVNKQEQFWKSLQKQFIETTKVWDEQSRAWRSVPMMDESGNFKLTNLGAQIKNLAGMAKDAVQPWIDQLSKWMDMTGKATGTVLAMFTNVVQGVKQITDNFMKLTGVSSETTSALGKLFSPEGWKVVQPVLNAIMTGMQAGINVVLNLFNMIAERAADAVNFWKKIVAAVEPLVNLVFPLYKVIKDMFDPKNAGQFGAAFKTAGDFAQGLLTILATLWDVTTDIVKVAIELGAQMVGAFGKISKGAADFIMNLVPGFTAAKAFFDLLLKNLPAIASGFNVFANWIKVGYDQFKNIITVVAEFVGIVSDGIGKTVVGVFTSIGKSLENITSGPAGAVLAWITQISDKFTQFADEKTGGAFSKIVALFTDFGTTLQTAGTALSQLFAISMSGLAAMAKTIELLGQKVAALGAVDLDKLFKEEGYRQQLMDSLSLTDADWQKITDEADKALLKALAPENFDLPPVTLEIKPYVSEDEKKKLINDLMLRVTSGLSDVGVSTLKPSEKLELVTAFEPDKAKSDADNAKARAEWEAKAQVAQKKADAYVEQQLQSLAARDTFSAGLSSEDAKVFNAKEYTYDKTLSTDAVLNDQMNAVNQQLWSQQKEEIEKKFSEYFKEQQGKKTVFDTSSLYEDIKPDLLPMIQEALLAKFQGTEVGLKTTIAAARPGLTSEESKPLIYGTQAWKDYVASTSPGLTVNEAGDVTGGKAVKQSVLSNIAANAPPGKDADNSQYIEQQTAFVKQLTKQLKGLFDQHRETELDADRNFLKQKARMLKDHLEAEVEFDKQFIRQKENSLRDFNKQSVRMDEDRARRSKDQAEDDARTRAKQVEDFNKQQLKAKEDFLLQMRRMDDDYYMSLEDAVQQRDATAVIRLERQHAINKRRAVDDFNRRQGDETKNFQDQWDEQIKERKEREQIEWDRQQRDRKIQYDRQLADMEENHREQEKLNDESFDKQLAKAEDAHLEQEKELDEAFERQKGEMVKSWGEIEGLTVDSVARVLAAVDAAMGTSDLAGRITAYVDAAKKNKEFTATVTFQTKGINGPVESGSLPAAGSLSPGFIPPTTAPVQGPSLPPGYTPPTAPVTPPAPPAPTTQEATTTGNMTVKKTPSVDSDAVDYLSKGKTTTVYGKSEDGARVAVHGDQGKSGWAATAYWSGLDVSKLPTLGPTASFASGGIMIADQPTTAIFGDAGKEAAIFLPLNKQLGLDSLSSLVGGAAGGAATNRSDMNLNIRISTDGTLTPEFEDKLMGRLADVIVAQVPKGVKVSQTK